MAQTVIGIFDKVTEAEQAMNQLLDQGFSRDQVDIADHTSQGNTAATNDDDDSIGGFFSSLFGSDSDDSRHHTDAAKAGTVVTVHATSMEEAERAANILDDHGTVNVNERMGMSNDPTAERTSADGNQTIDVIEEELNVGKRDVKTGGVRVRSRIVEKPVEETLRLRTEHVHVARNPVNRPATEAEIGNLKDSDIEVTEHAESAVVSKEARVVEEITIDKEVEEHDEVISDTVRSTEVDVEETASEDRNMLEKKPADRDSDRKA